jgi:mannitol-1-phosphate/altronate dehydrogenase
VGALLEFKTIFGAELPADQRFRQAVSDALARLYSVGSRQTIEGLARLGPQAKTGPLP